MTSPAALPQEFPVREHFIPVRAEDLTKLLVAGAQLQNDERESLLHLCTILRASIHHHYHILFEQLKNLYAPFDPDADTVAVACGTNADQKGAEPLFDQLTSLFERANFVRLDREDMDEAIAASNNLGIQLDVDFSIFDRLEVFVRGESAAERSSRDWKQFYRVRTYRIPVHQRLVVAFQVRHDIAEAMGCNGTISLKLFKNIPKRDIEMLLPGTRVRMTMLDRVRIALPTVSGLVVTIIKIVKGAVVLAFAGVYGILAFLGLVGGTIGYGIKSFFGYLHTKDKYQASLTKHLYFQNLDNNAGVLFRILDEVEEQEYREVIIAYSILRDAPPAGLSLQELDTAAEILLHEATGMDVDFEADDALEKLLRFKLAVEVPGGRYLGVDLMTALEQLDHAWDSHFPWNTGNRDAAASSRLHTCDGLTP